MTCPQITAALLAGLLTTAAVAEQLVPTEKPAEQQSTQSADEHDGAHGYQNPEGRDPDPRMSEHPNSETEETEKGDTQHDDQKP